MSNQMAVMGQEGDTKVLWDPNNTDEVDNARATFDRMVGGKKYLAFAVKSDGDKGNQLREFDPQAGKIILVPPMVGG